MFEFHKGINRLKIKLGYRLGLSKAIGMPKMITIDPTNHCNLKCPLCVTGEGDTSVEYGFLSWINIKRSLIYSANGLKTYNFFHGVNQF